MRYLSAGKLDTRLLEELLHKYPGARDPRLVVGPRVGEDAAVIDMGDRYLVAKSDPITYATEQIGWYAVNVNANDIATLGAEPRWFLATVLLPQGSNEALVEGIFSDMSRASEELGVSLCGGHTEVTAGLVRPIVAGHMLGEVAKDRLVLKANARPGDEVILTKGIAIEGTAIIAREKGSELVTCFGRELVQRAQDFLYHPGISIVKEALLASRAARVHAMHDLTEGGLATGVKEMAAITGLGATLNRKDIHCYRETEALCAHFGLDPLGTIASGALLIATAPEDTQKVLAALREGGIECEVIGYLTEEKKGLKIMEDGRPRELPLFEVDEIARLFASAKKD